MDNVLLLLSSCGLVFVFADRLSGEMLFMMVVDNLLLLNLGFDEFVYLHRSSGQMLSMMIMDNLLLPLSVGVMDSVSWM